LDDIDRGFAGGRIELSASCAWDESDYAPTWLVRQARHARIEFLTAKSVQIDLACPRGARHLPSMPATDRLAQALSGRYLIEREIGAGGMALVYLAEDLKHRRSVAIKVLKPELAATLGSDRFLREIEIAARLSHPHILPLFDSGAAGDLLYYVMPFVPGESLRARIVRERQLSIDDALRLTREIASALGFAHQMASRSSPISGLRAP
jgi:hypothetical protein